MKSRVCLDVRMHGVCLVNPVVHFAVKMALEGAGRGRVLPSTTFNWFSFPSVLGVATYIQRAVHDSARKPSYANFAAYRSQHS